MTLVLKNKSLTIDEELVKFYPPDVLDDIFRVHFLPFFQSHIDHYKEWNLNKRDFEGLSLRIQDIVNVISITLTEESLFLTWFDHLPYMVSKVYETLVWEGRKSVFELNERTKGKILLSSELEDIGLDCIQKDFHLFLLSPKKTNLDANEKYYHLELPNNIRIKSRAYLPKPKGYYLYPIKNIENTSKDFLDQGKILQFFRIIHEYVNQGNLVLNKDGSLKKNQIKKLQQIASIEEFFEGDEFGQLGLFRSELIVQLLLKFDGSMNSIESAESIKKLFEQYAKHQVPILTKALSHIKGWYQVSDELNKAYQCELRNLIKEMPLNKWVSIKQIQRFMLVRDLGVNLVFEESISKLYLAGGWKGWGNIKQAIKFNQVSDLIEIPYLNQNLFLFASFGLLDLKYDFYFSNDPESLETNNHHLLNSIKYIRLTEFGAYVLGVKSEFTQIQLPTDKTKLILDEDRLIVTISKPDPRIEMVLGEMAQRIGRLRFKTDFELFLSKCESNKEINSRINEFVNFSENSIPALWQQFFDKIRQNSHSIFVDDSYMVFKLDKSNEEILELFTSNKEIRQLALLSENYRILVRKKDLNKLRKKLSIFGYHF